MTDILDDSYESDLTDEEHERLILMSQHTFAKPITNPLEAGFDGAKGINLNNPSMPDGGLYRLRRTSNPPWEYNKDCRNQLVWQQSEPPHLFYCNADGQWFELTFNLVNP